MTFVLKRAIIHSISKEKNTTVIAAIVKKTILLPVDNVAVLNLVQGVNGLLGKPGNILSYGQFADDMRGGKFPVSFSDYVFNLDDDNEFLELSYCALDQLADRAREESFATGGHLLVAAYDNDASPFFLVAMIKQRGGIILDAEYVPKTIEEVDMSKVHQAARVNINRYKEVSGLAPADDAADVEDRTYLAFVGARTDPAAGYFVAALGCTKGMASSRATSNVIAAVDAFFKTPDLKHHRAEAKNAVIAYLSERLHSGLDATVTDIAFRAGAVLKSNQEEVIEEFRIYLNSEQVKVPAAFPVHRTTLNKNTRIKGEKTGSWSVQFEKVALGNSPNSSIYFDAKKKSLTFNGVPDDVANEIQSELDARNN